MKNSKRCRTLLCLAVLGPGLAALSGCQTNVAGMTLPSPHYLEHPPQYIPPSPPYPLPRELASQEAIYAAPVPGAVGAPGGGGPAPLPPPVPVPPLGPGGPGAPPGPAQLPPPAPAP
jgi:hypothetical protein